MMRARIVRPSLLLLAASLPLVGCKTLNQMADTARNAFAPIAPAHPAPAAAPLAAASAPGTPKVADVSAEPFAASPDAPPAGDLPTPGYLHFILPDAPWGTEGWRFEALAAKSTAGFIPLASSPRLGSHLKLALWPDQYQIRVSLRNDARLSQWVQIQAGQHTVVYVDLGMIADTVHVLYGDRARERLGGARAPSRELGLMQTFGPLRLSLGPGTEGRWYGPRQDDQARGTGRLDLFRGNSRIGRIDDAQALPGEQGGFEGVPALEDGRTVEGRWHGRGFADGSVMRFPDGRIFQGSYVGDTPVTGALTLPDGRIWMGRVADGEPAGAGDLRLADGTVIHGVPGIDDTVFDGEYECTLPSGKTVACVYFEGERLASLAEYVRRDKARQAALARDVAQARELAVAARATDASVDPMSRDGLAAAVAAAQETQARYASTPVADSVLDRPQLASAGPAASGCVKVEGAFSTTTGLSKVSFTADGQGHFWQKTYGGARSYTFEVDFRWQGEASKMTFDYDEATYYDAAGQVMQRTRMPGGTVECRYDGREISIGGVSYFRL